MGVIRERDRQGSDQGFAQRGQGVELRQNCVVGVEVRHEQDVAVLDVVDGREAAQLDVVMARVREATPLRREEGETRGRERLQLFGGILEGRGGEDVVALALGQAAPRGRQRDRLGDLRRHRARRRPRDRAVGVLRILVHELPVLGLQGDLARPGRPRPDFADDLSADAEGLGDLDDPRRRVLVGVDLVPVTHVEDLVHLFPRSSGILLDDAEYRGDGEEAVLHHMHAVDEVQDLRLAAAAAMHHAADVAEEAVVAHPFHHWRVRAGRRQQQLRRGNLMPVGLDDVLEPEPAAVDELARHAAVEGLRELLHQALAQHVVPGGC
mmetsp:Transcript_85115/g.260072  ORF Transcript_85115/g.260072 Transcript_85115/m.260072 type:complete len:323 (-) Transcript_85115:687-1655(-)